MTIYVTDTDESICKPDDPIVIKNKELMARLEAAGHIRNTERLDAPDTTKEESTMMNEADRKERFDFLEWEQKMVCIDKAYYDPRLSQEQLIVLLYMTFPAGEITDVYKAKEGIHIWPKHTIYFSIAGDTYRVSGRGTNVKDYGPVEVDITIGGGKAVTTSKKSRFIERQLNVALHRWVIQCFPNIARRRT